MMTPAKECDRLFSLVVRAVGYCESRRPDHAGVLQCAHGFSRRYHATRWNRANAWCLCQGCHMYFTHHPLEWDDWLREEWGEPFYRVMRELALTGSVPDLKELVVRLRAEAKELAA